MYQMKYVLTAIGLFCCTQLFSQNKSVGFGEKLVYTAAYNMSGLLTDVAEVNMETSKIRTSKSTLMRIKCAATTYSGFDGFFKIRDLYESYVSPTTLKPYLYKREINEGGYYKFMQYKYSYKSNTVKSLKKKRRGDGSIWEEKKNIRFDKDTKDLVATFYSIRNLEIDNATVGDVSSFKVLFDNEVSTLLITYLGKETISTKIGSKKCYKISINLKGSDILKGNNANLLWLTADENKIPVLARFKIAVGSGELKIKSATGLKN